MRGLFVQIITLVLWVGASATSAALTADEVIARVQQQLAVPSELVLGAMQTYVNERPHRHYAFVLARHWQPVTETESVRIDFDSPVTLPDMDSSLRAQNRYLLRRVGRTPPTQWLYLPALRRVRIAPYHPAERLLQSEYWFYDLTAISNLDDYQYHFADQNPAAPVIEGTPRVAFVPYTKVQLRCERRGDTYLITVLTAWAPDVTRDAQFSDYQEIAPGRFRPQHLSVREGNAGRTDLTFQHWQLDAAGPELFTGAALETRSLTVLGSETAPP